MARGDIAMLHQDGDHKRRVLRARCLNEPVGYAGDVASTDKLDEVSL